MQHESPKQSLGSWPTASPSRRFVSVFFNPLAWLWRRRDIHNMHV